MLRQLRFDFYKITRSKVITWQWLLPFLLLLLLPLIRYGINKSVEPVVDDIVSAGNGLLLVSIIFSVLLVSKDFSSGYIKNVRTFSNTLFYILSKFVYIAAVCVLYLVFEFFIEWAFSAIFSEGILYNPELTAFPTKDFVLMYVIEALNAIAIGMVCCFLCVLLKRDYVVFIITLSYLFFISANIYMAIDGIYDTPTFNVRNYTLFGFNSFHYYGERAEGIYTKGLLVQICYIVVFGFFSWLILKKRDVV